MDKKHSLSVTDSGVTIGGVTDVVSVFEKEVVVNTVKGRLAVSGEKLNVKKLEVDEGLVVIEFANIAAIKYGAKKTGLGNIFK
ncbi:MAG TPA: YabP/YqfC family sporulation protein [Clostridia bacterium]|nr:YabP/YqfC family sporulation protein [Clostridia bacterium]